MGPSSAVAVREAIGNTPLMRLERASAMTGCEILAKAEFMNPGGSLKDRAALAIISAAERDGLLEPGGFVVEGTAGNTGIGLTMVANAAGYRTVIVMPETQSREKQQALRALGAELHLVPETHHDDPNNYRRVARRMADALAADHAHGAVWADQFDNLANRDGHYRTTGPEIWEQARHQVDAFICSVGTGGCLAGTARFLGQVHPGVVIGLADPDGAAMYDYFTSGELTYAGTSIAEGVGLRWMTKNLEGTAVDVAVRIGDREALESIWDLARHEGLFVGGSSGINVAGAMHLARRLGPGHTIVTILCDSGLRYQDKLLDREFLAARSLPLPPWEDDRHPTLGPGIDRFLEPPVGRPAEQFAGGER